MAWMTIAEPISWTVIATSALAELPTELLYDIISHVINQGSLKYALRLRLINKRFSCIVPKIIYTTLIPDQNLQWAQRCDFWQSYLTYKILNSQGSGRNGRFAFQLRTYLSLADTVRTCLPGDYDVKNCIYAISEILLDLKMLPELLSGDYQSLSFPADNDNSRLLVVASCLGAKPLVEKLLDISQNATLVYGAEVSVRATELAARHGHTDIVELFLRNSTSEVCEFAAKGAAEGGHLDTFRRVMQYCEGRGTTMTIYVTRRALPVSTGNLEIYKYCLAQLRKLLNPKDVDEVLETVLTMALEYGAQQGHTSGVAFILATEPVKVPFEALVNAATKCNAAVLRALCEASATAHPESFQQSLAKYTILTKPVARSHRQCTAILLSYLPPSYFRTTIRAPTNPLLDAILADSKDIYRLLVCRGTRVDVECPHTRLILLAACQRDSGWRRLFDGDGFRLERSVLRLGLGGSKGRDRYRTGVELARAVERRNRGARKSFWEVGKMVWRWVVGWFGDGIQ